MQKRGFLKVLIIAILLSGCATIQSINANYAKVNSKDGISKKEAEAIAQKKLLDIREGGPYILSLPQAEDRGLYWQVFFYSLYMNKNCFIINVNKETGEVVYFYES